MNDKLRDDWGDDFDPEVIKEAEEQLEEDYAPGVHIPWEALEANIVCEAKMLYGTMYTFSGFESSTGLLISDEELARWSYVSKGKIPRLLKVLEKKKLIVFMGFEELEDGSRARRIKKNRDREWESMDQEYLKKHYEEIKDE